MRTGAAAGHAGYFHETASYGSDDEFVDLVRPFLADGVAAGEPVVVACADHNAGLVRRAVGTRGIRFLPGGDHYAQPGPTIRDHRRLFSDLVATGASQIRVVGDVPHPGTGAAWEGWMRYEAAVNVAYDDFPVWGLCPYDTRTTPADVLHDVACTHPRVVGPTGDHLANPAFVDPTTFLDERSTRGGPHDGPGRPALHLVDPTPRRARREVARLARHELAPPRVEDLVVVVSELVTNAHLHGSPPVVVRAWSGPGRVDVAVSDAGPGPEDPMAGWRAPPVGEVGGRGLWLALQLAGDLRVDRSDGTQVRCSFR